MLSSGPGQPLNQRSPAWQDCSRWNWEFSIWSNASSSYKDDKIRRSFTTEMIPRLGLFGNKVPGHTTRAPTVGFELAANGIQFYAYANVD